GKTGQHYVFVVPVKGELDLKKAASAVGEKSIELVAVKELLPLTGYVRGGCSPVGMKKLYPTVFHNSVENLTSVIVSAGKIGYQVEVAPQELLTLVRGSTADIIV
ncbi:MAG: Cys-tRNA(Pro) deacylase, partial [Oscillospiraceae bacterium]|nr:Cys-tRNA(Pro) deacylase [Oscillospiraceae bacterium]